MCIVWCAFYILLGSRCIFVSCSITSLLRQWVFIIDICPLSKEEIGDKGREKEKTKERDQRKSFHDVFPKVFPSHFSHMYGDYCFMGTHSASITQGYKKLGNLN